MAANRILQELKAFTDFANTGFKYNLQVFPDTATAAALLFTILFQNPQFGALTGSLVLLRFLHPVLGSFLSSLLDGTLGEGDAERCSGLFPGASYESLIGAATAGKMGALKDNVWPSFYSTFLGFIAGYVGLLPVVYQAEFAASPRQMASVVTGSIILIVTVILGIVYRVMSGCDNGFGIAVGIVSGFIMGAAIMAFLAWISDRRITNILNFPLIRGKAADGRPIYVCDRRKPAV